MPRKFQVGSSLTSTTVDGKLVSVTPDRAGSPVNPVLVGVTDINAREQEQVRFGRESREVFFDTLFDDFSLVATAHYNFYEPGEETDESEKNYSTLQDLPRYILLTWNRTPPISQEKPEVRFGVRSSPTSVGSVTDVKGMKFDVSRVTDFSTVRQMTVNPHLSLGVADLTVIIPEVSANESGVDEELYLLSESGVPVNHIASNDRVLKSHIQIDQLGTMARAGGVMKDPNASLRIAPPPMVSARSTMRFTADAVLGAIGEGAVGPADGRLHLENVLKLSAFSTEVGLISVVDDILDERRVDEPSVPSPDGLPAKEYIGYVIEKQALGSDGVFKTVHEFEVDDPTVTYLIDTSVAYGGVYRYRMKALLRWTHGSDVPLMGKPGQSPSMSPTRPITPRVSHFIESSWSEYETATVLDLSPPMPPDDLRVRTDSRRGTIEVAWRYPADPQMDIISFDLHRRTMRGGVFTSPWMTIASGLRAANGRFVDTDVQMSDDQSERYVYAMTSNSVHGEVSDLSVQISCRLNPFYAFEGEAELRQESQPGATLSSHGALSVIPHRRMDMDVVARRRLTVVPRTGMSKFPNQDVDLVVRLESLDTGEYRDILVDLNNIQTETTKLPPPRPGRVPVDGVFPDDRQVPAPRVSTGLGQVAPPSKLATVV